MRSLNALACLAACVAGVPHAWAFEPGITPVVSAAAEASHLIKAAPGHLYSLYVTTGTTAGYLMTFNANAVPADGGCHPGRVRHGAGQQHDLDQFQRAARHLFARDRRGVQLDRLLYQDRKPDGFLQSARAMKLGAAAGVLAFLHAAPLWAQSVQYGPASSGGVAQSGSVTAGDIAAWAGTGLIRDGGNPAGTVSSVGLTMPPWLTVSGSPVTAAGTLSVAGAPQAGNLFLASPSLSSGAMAPRAIVGADLPLPGSSGLGGVESLAPIAHSWLDSISTSGAPHASQPSCSDLAGAAPSCSVDATNAGNIASGTLPAARLPNILPANTTFSGNNVYSGTSTWSGSLYVPIRVVTAAGPVSISAATDYMIVIDETSPAPTAINYACTPGFTFLIKDGDGKDATNPITLRPTSGTIDGAASFIMNASTTGAPPYEARAVTCDASGNSWVN